jgi:hypothetical protein
MHAPGKRRAWPASARSRIVRTPWTAGRAPPCHWSARPRHRHRPDRCPRAGTTAPPDDRDHWVHRGPGAAGVHLREQRGRGGEIGREVDVLRIPRHHRGVQVLLGRRQIPNGGLKYPSVRLAAPWSTIEIVPRSVRISAYEPKIPRSPAVRRDSETPPGSGGPRPRPTSAATAGRPWHRFPVTAAAGTSGRRWPAGS